MGPNNVMRCMVVFQYIFSICHGPPLSYLHEKKLMPVRIMNTSVGLISKNIMIVSVFSLKVLVCNYKGIILG